MMEIEVVHIQEVSAFGLVEHADDVMILDMFLYIGLVYIIFFCTDSFRRS